MKLASPQWTNTLEWDTIHPACLVLENPSDYLTIVDDLSRQAEGEEGTLIFSDQGRICSLTKDGLLVRDLWAPAANQRKIIAAIGGRLNQIALDENYEAFRECLGHFENFFDELVKDSMLPLEWTTPDNLLPLLKAFDLRIEAGRSPFERLLDYVHLGREFLHLKFLVLIGCRGFLSEEDCVTFTHELAIGEIPVLFIEPYCLQMVPSEKRLVIDRDHCELLFS